MTTTNAAKTEANGSSTNDATVVFTNPGFFINRDMVVSRISATMIYIRPRGLPGPESQFRLDGTIVGKYPAKIDIAKTFPNGIPARNRK